MLKNESELVSDEEIQEARQACSKDPLCPAPRGSRLVLTRSWLKGKDEGKDEGKTRQGLREGLARAFS